MTPSSEQRSEIVSHCCSDPVRVGKNIGYAGVVDAYVCTACERYCQGVRQWNRLPEPGAFEAPYDAERAAIHRAAKEACS